eukprot:TRINITY_DN82865_c0_g1_i1.p1 TRINITY_DN82865_c0_g1~~TRINITY_DN82865_c0_g1_i1.p1  ORF type:complete len:154 (+),score=55.81 TRINITY_DN82865_c0_g1_i1:89-550(+)
MKLLTHNFLTCISCGEGELLLRASKTEERKSPQKEAFLMNIIERVDYQRLVRAWHMLGFSMEGVPTEIPEELSDEFLALLHHMLVEMVVIDGMMKCDKCGKEFLIENGIPHMIENWKAMNEGGAGEEEVEEEEEDEGEEDMEEDEEEEEDADI